MRIIALANKNSGPSYHRIIMPFMLMNGPDVYITNDLLKDEDFQKGCDILIYNRVLPDKSTEEIAAFQKKYGFKIVVDIDDWWELDPHHVLYDEYLRVDFGAQQIAHIKGADLVTTTHERLAELISKYNDNVHVLPNAIPKQGQFDMESKPYHFTRLFWQGSDTHKEDVRILERPLEALGMLSPKIKMIMAGYVPDHADWHQMAKTYTANLKLQYKLIPYAHIGGYYAAYDQADICLVPLVNSPFNRMKSNLKILEAANLGLPVIASAVHPYLGMPVSYCRNSRDWIGHIKRLVQFPARRKEEGQRLAEYCDEHYNFHKINEERKQILEYAASKTVA